MEAYLLKRRNTVVQYISTQPMLELYKEIVQMPVMWLQKIGGSIRDWTWWERGQRRRQ